MSIHQYILDGDPASLEQRESAFDDDLAPHVLPYGLELGTGPLHAEPGYPAAVAEEARSHDDVSHERLTSAYRDLVRDCALMSPDFREYEIADLPELTADDLGLIQRAKGLTEVSPVKDALQALLEDVIIECECRNERRAEARDQDAFERYHGGDSSFDERERTMSELGLRERDFR